MNRGSRESKRSFRLAELVRRDSLRILGLNSGTSGDGLNAVLAEFRKGSPPRVLKSAVYPFSKKISHMIIAAGEPGADAAEAWPELHMTLGRLFGEKAGKFLRSAGPGLTADLIASHGQTVRHLPRKLITVQLGDPALIASIAALPVIADFRSSDIAAGGQGAPLSPILHDRLFTHEVKWRGILNIGGIANITILPSSKSRRKPFAADCGPGNMVVDELIRRLYGRRFDKNGRIALSGKADQTAVKKMMKNKFFQLPPPKSTGRELFGRKFAALVLKSMKDKPDTDVIATASEITVRAAAQFVKTYAPRLHELYLCGGGAQNEYFSRFLSEELSGVKVDNVARLGYSPGDIEALLWAYLAWRFVTGKSIDTRRFTGARRAHIPGALWLP